MSARHGRSMGYQTGVGRTQASMFPPTIEELIPAEHMVRVIDAYVQSLDLRQLKFARGVAADTGRPGFDPRDLLKLYWYAYWHRLRRSRVLERECERNVELMWMMGGLRPDFRTIAKFRSDNVEALQQACAGFVQFLREVKLIGEGVSRVAIDGSKFKASAAKASVLDGEQLAKARARVDKAIQSYLQELDAADAQEQSEVEPDREAIQGALKGLKAKAERLQQAERALKESPPGQPGEGRVSLTDADGLRLRASGGGHTVGYNVQQAVEAKHKIIIAHEVTRHANDHQSLLPGAPMAYSALGAPSELTVLADTG
jgi:transposase